MSRKFPCKSKSCQFLPLAQVLLSSTWPASALYNWHQNEFVQLSSLMLLKLKHVNNKLPSARWFICWTFFVKWMRKIPHLQERARTLMGLKATKEHEFLSRKTSWLRKWAEKFFRFLLFIKFNGFSDNFSVLLDHKNEFTEKKVCLTSMKMSTSAVEREQHKVARRIYTNGEKNLMKTFLELFCRPFSVGHR